MSKLQSTTMAFGDKFSPTAVTKAQVEAILRSIEDADNTTNYSGYISMAVDSINAAEEFTLAANGITFQGAVTPVEFSVRADRTSISDDSNITFYTEGLPFPSLIFSVKEVTVTKGEISADEVKSLCSFNGNILHVAAANMPYEWAASIVVNVETRFTPKTEHAVTINCKVKPYTAFIVSESNVNMHDGETKIITLTYSPIDATIPIVQTEATLSPENETYTVTGVSSSQVILQCNSTETLVPATLNIVATDKAGNTLRNQVSLTNKVIPAISIEGEDSFMAKNGKGSAAYAFGFNPSNYNVAVSIVSVTSNNNAVVVNDMSVGGFELSVDGIEADASAVITAVMSVDGKNVTIKKTVNITYKQIFNEFKVYKNSAWVVPSSNVEVKVGDVVAEYIGDGIWMVDETLVDESMDVTAGGVVLGKYGVNEYSDGTGFVNKTASGSDNDSLLMSLFENLDSTIAFSDFNSFNLTDMQNGYVAKADFKIVYPCYLGGIKTISLKSSSALVYVNNTFVERISFYASGLSSATKITKVNKGDVILIRGDKDNEIIKLGINTKNTRVSVKEDNFLPDLSIPTTSFIAKNGDLDEMITPETPNGGSVVITGVSSSNSAISASVVDGKIKLSGNVADGFPQSATLTVNYTVNGHTRRYDVEISATFQERKDDNGHEFVDLGLPSGLMWAKYNVGATSEDGEGLYFQWGDTEGHTKDSGYNFSADNFNAKGLNDISADLSLDNDAAHKYMGGSWRMPTKDEFEELINYCDWVYTEQYNIKGYKVTSKSNGNYIFLGFTGYFLNTEIYNFGEDNSNYWACTFDTQYKCGYMLMLGKNGYSVGQTHGAFGFNIRAVM